MAPPAPQEQRQRVERDDEPAPLGAAQRREADQVDGSHAQQGLNGQQHIVHPTPTQESGRQRERQQQQRCHEGREPRGVQTGAVGQQRDALARQQRTSLHLGSLKHLEQVVRHDDLVNIRALPVDDTVADEVQEGPAPGAVLHLQLGYLSAGHRFVLLWPRAEFERYRVEAFADETQGAVGTASGDVVVGQVDAVGGVIVEHAPQVALGSDGHVEGIFLHASALFGIATNIVLRGYAEQSHLEVAGHEAQYARAGAFRLVGEGEVHVESGALHAQAGVAETRVERTARLGHQQRHLHEVRLVTIDRILRRQPQRGNAQDEQNQPFYFKVPQFHFCFYFHSFFLF